MAEQDLKCVVDVCESVFMKAEVESQSGLVWDT